MRQSVAVLVCSASNLLTSCAHGGQLPIVKTDPAVTITVSGRQLSVDIDPALVKKDFTLIWKVTGLEKGHKVEIDIVSDGNAVGPFPRRAEEPRNPTRGRYVFTSSEQLETTRAERVGTWKYQVILRGPNEEDLDSLDPVIVVKNGHVADP
jgi:hypothetical protein